MHVYLHVKEYEKKKKKKNSHIMLISKCGELNHVPL